MADSERIEAIRHQLIMLVRRKSARFAEFSKDVPIHWSPGTVTNPTTGAPITPSGAWDFIAECLEKGVPLDELILEKPPGARAFYFTVDASGCKVYVKLQLGNGKVFGRSFHQSEPGGSK